MLTNHHIEKSKNIFVYKNYCFFVSDEIVYIFLLNSLYFECIQKIDIIIILHYASSLFRCWAGIPAGLRYGHTSNRQAMLSHYYHLFFVAYMYYM